MNSKKLWLICMTMIMPLTAPFILPAQQPGQNERIGPTTYRLIDITGRAIVIPGRVNPEQGNNGNGPTPTATPGDDGMDAIPFQEEDTPLPMESDVIPLPDGQDWGMDDDNGVSLEVGAVRDLIIDSAGQVSLFVADLSENRDWNWWSGRGLYIIPAGAFTAQESEGELIFELSQVVEGAIPRAESEAAIRELLPADSAAATRLKDFSITGSNNENLGYIEDLVVDVAQNQVVYAALATGGFLGVGTRLYAIPFYEIQFNAEQAQIQLSMTLEQLQSRESFDPGNWPATATP